MRLVARNSTIVEASWVFTAGQSGSAALSWSRPKITDVAMLWLGDVKKQRLV